MNSLAQTGVKSAGWAKKISHAHDSPRDSFALRRAGMKRRRRFVEERQPRPAVLNAGRLSRHSIPPHYLLRSIRSHLRSPI